MVLKRRVGRNRARKLGKGIKEEVVGGRGWVGWGAKRGLNGVGSKVGGGSMWWGGVK